MLLVRPKVASCRSALVPSSHDLGTRTRLRAGSPARRPRRRRTTSSISRDQLARRQLLLACRSRSSLPSSPKRTARHLFSSIIARRIDAEGQVVAAQLPQLRDDRLEDRRDADRFVDARADVADAELERRIRCDAAARPTRSSSHRGCSRVRTSASSSSSYSSTIAHDRRHAGAREVPEDDAAVRLEPRVAAHPERRAGGQREHVRQK